MSYAVTDVHEMVAVTLEAAPSVSRLCASDDTGTVGWGISSQRYRIALQLQLERQDVSGQVLKHNPHMRFVLW